jgi:hypothetical protein
MSGVGCKSVRKRRDRADLVDIVRQLGHSRVKWRVRTFAVSHATTVLNWRAGLAVIQPGECDFNPAAIGDIRLAGRLIPEFPGFAPGVVYSGS